MGILYSHIVFQPPSPPSYSDDAGVMSFRKAKHDGQDSDDDQSVAPSTDATVAGSSEQQYVQHPIIYLRTSRGNSIPAAYFHQPDSYYTILFSHVSFFSQLIVTVITLSNCYAIFRVFVFVFVYFFHFSWQYNIGCIASLARFALVQTGIY